MDRRIGSWALFDRSEFYLAPGSQSTYADEATIQNPSISNARCFKNNTRRNADSKLKQYTFSSNQNLATPPPKKKIPSKIIIVKFWPKIALRILPRIQPYMKCPPLPLTYSLAGVCRPSPQILILFQTRKSNFLYPVSDQTAETNALIRCRRNTLKCKQAWKAE